MPDRRAVGEAPRRRTTLLGVAVTAAVVAACGDTPSPFPTPPDDPPPSQPTAARIFIARADGSAPIPVAVGSRGAWSPNSRRIAFQRGNDVFVIDADGRNERRIISGQSPSWAPDGGQLLFRSVEGIAVTSIDGSAVRTLIRHTFRDDTYKPSDLGVDKPVWSPDGELVAFEHLGDGDIQPAQVFVTDANGGNVRRVTRLSNSRMYAESDPAWSRDGSKLMYWSYGYGIAITERQGGVPATVYSDFAGGVVYGAKPVWLPDGQTIAFNRSDSSPSGCSIWTIAPSGGAARQLITNACDAVWSPDGSRVAFTSKRTP